MKGDYKADGKARSRKQEIEGNYKAVRRQVVAGTSGRTCGHLIPNRWQCVASSSAGKLSCPGGHTNSSCKVAFRRHVPFTMYPTRSDICAMPAYEYGGTHVL